VAISLNAPNAGLVVGSASADRHDQGSSLVGLRFSTRDYRAGTLLRRPVLVDLHEALEPRASLLFGQPRDPFGALVSRLRGLGRDPEVGAVVLRMTPVGLAPGHADELRATLLEIRTRKPVIAWIEGAGLREYYVATGATRIEMLPPALLTMTGISTSGLYLRDTLSKLGVAFQAVAIGKYKSAPDTLGRSEMSPAEREALDAVLDDLFGRQVKAIAEARRLPEERVRALVDQGIFSAAAAREAGLVDALSWPDELERSLGAPGGLARPGDPPQPRLAQRWGPVPAVAVVRVAGLIVPGRSRGGLLDSRLTGAETVAGLVRRAAEDAGVRAIVLRVDSPGGDALASDVIWRSLVQARRRGKPVVISMGDVAASGGYWIATGGDLVVAEPSTITGSIGVFAQKPDLSGLLAKIGATQVTLKRGARADIESPFRPWTEAEQEAIRKEVGAIYDTFLSRVAEARKLSREATEQVAQGRIWTGAQARERGLVDRLGSLADAIALARERAGIPAAQPIDVRLLDPPRTMPWEALDAAFSSADPLSRLLGQSTELQAAAGMLEMGRVVALPAAWVEPLAGPPAGGAPSGSVLSPRPGVW
jgi:protease-4